MLHSYLNRVHQLLGSDSFPGLTNRQLSVFKSTYGPTAFVCRFFGCTQSTTGFANDQLRRQHELTHAPPLICNNSSCTYGLSFGSLEALKRHMRENHEDTPPSIPASVRLRSVKLSSTALENGVSTQPASSAAGPVTYTCVYRGCALRFETLQELQKHKRDKHHRNLNSLSNESGHMISSSPSQSQSHERDSISYNITKAHTESSFDTIKAHRKPMPAITVTAYVDYCAQLFYLEVQNKKKLLRARAEQDGLVEGNLQYETTVIADNKGSLKCKCRGTVSGESTVVCKCCATRQHTRCEYGVTHVSEVQKLVHLCWICYPEFGTTAESFFHLMRLHGS